LHTTLYEYRAKKYNKKKTVNFADNAAG